MKKLIAIICAALIVSTAVISVNAEGADESDEAGESIEWGESVAVGDFIISARLGENLDASDYSYNNSSNELTILSNKPMMISGNSTSDRIVVNSPNGANITLSNISISTTISRKAAFEITGGDTVTVTLVGNNTLTSGSFCAGLQNNNVPLFIQGGGKLTATGGVSGAGIGGGAGKDGQNITIGKHTETDVEFSGTVIANGGSTDNGYQKGNGGAGIGGINGGGENITINGSGTVEATGGYGGAGIGGGQGGKGNTINISGSGTIKATGNGNPEANAAGIGGGAGGRNTTGGAGENIIINLSSGGKIIAQGGSSGGDGWNPAIGGAGIGGGGGGTDNGALGGGNGKNITISGSGTVEATSSKSGGAGIGGGGAWDGVSGGNGENIIIHGGNVTATGGSCSAGIGGGGGGTSGVGAEEGKGSKGEVIITGGNVTAIGDVGIGGGILNNCSNSTVTISGSSTVSATGVNGIRGGNITISGGKIEAKGTDGAGIGGNTWDVEINVTITGGEVTAIGTTAKGTPSVGIGGSYRNDDDDKANSTVIIKGIGNTSFPWVFTNEIKSTEGDDEYWGVVFDEAHKNTYTELVGDTGKTYAADGVVYGEVDLTKLAKAYTLESDKLLRVQNGATLKTANKLKLQGTLYLEADAKLDKYDEIEIDGGEILHEHSSIYVEDDSSGELICDICGKKHKHEWTEWVDVLDEDIHQRTCENQQDCSVFKCDFSCDATDDGEHDYDFDNPTEDNPKIENGQLHYYCQVCGHEYIVGIPIIYLTKVDGETGAALEGAEFGLYSDAKCTDDNRIATGTTEIDNGKAVVSFAAEQLKKTYYIKEIEAPAGYEISDKVYKAVVDADGNVTYGVAGSEDADSEDADSEDVDSVDTLGTVFVCKNYAVEVISGTVQIIKVDGKTGAALAGAEFGLYSDEQCNDANRIAIGTTEIDNDSASDTYDKAVVTFAAEANKTYYIKEIIAPAGYKVSDKVYKAVVDEDGNVTYGTVGSEDAGSEDADSEDVDSVDTLGTVLVCKNYAVEVVVITGTVQIIKVDGKTGDPLAGADFGLYSDAECKNLITTETTKIDDDSASDTYDKAVVTFAAEANKTYYIKETEAPEGYEISDKVYKAVVDADGNVTYGTVGSEDADSEDADSETPPEDIPVCKNYAVEVVVITGTAKIIKEDGKTGDPLTEAEFGLYSDAECKNLITTETTEIDTDDTSDTYNKAVVSFTTEPNKTYYIKETKAPDGYKVSDKVYKAVVGADGNVTYGTVGSEDTDSETPPENIPVCKNYAVEVVIISGTAKIIKEDGKTGDPLTGADFGLYSDAECKNLITTETTEIDTDDTSDTYDKAVVSFIIEANKIYYIKETKAPDGYKVSDKVYKAVVGADGNVTYGTVGSEDTDSETPPENIPVCKNYAVEVISKPTDDIEESKEPTDDTEESKEPTDDIEESKEPTDDTEESKEPTDDTEEDKEPTDDTEEDGETGVPPTVSPETGDMGMFSTAGIAILSGIAYAASLVGEVQKRKRKNSDDDVADF